MLPAAFFPRTGAPLEPEPAPWKCFQRELLTVSVARRLEDPPENETAYSFFWSQYLARRNR